MTIETVFTPANTTDQTLDWSTSDSSVATVANGVVTGVSTGTAIISAVTSNGLKATCTVTVIACTTTNSIPAPSAGSSTALTAEQIYSRCSPAVFCIVEYDQYGEPYAMGSGFFITSSGVAVTNYHVIEGAYAFQIILSDGSTCWVDSILATDASKDLAILKAEGSGFTALPIGNSASVTGGQTIYAIGTPKGLTNTISDGIVSNPCRTTYGVPYIQISAPIASGSSGGALINEYGQVIGVTCASVVDGQNLNLAVPINLIYTLGLQ